MFYPSFKLVFTALLFPFIFTRCGLDRTVFPIAPEFSVTTEQVFSPIKVEGTNCPFGNPLVTNPQRYGRIDIIHREGYTLGHSSKYKMAIWVCEEIRREELIGNAKRRDHFKPDPFLINGESPNISDYKYSGYDRGHLAAADNYKNDQRLNDETFFLSNISPQIHTFNTGVWKRLELQIRNWAFHYGKIYVITGPLFLEISEVASKSFIDLKINGRDRVRIPPFFYKILVKDKEILSVFALVVRHEPISPNIKLNSLIFPVQWIEDRSSIDFLPALPNSYEYYEKNIGTFWN